MYQVSKESPVALEHLDDYLKAILKLKIREFVHLSPWFRNIPSINTRRYPSTSVRRTSAHLADRNECPNRGHKVYARHRHMRLTVI